MALIDQDATIRALVQLHEETGVKTAQSIRVVREMPEADVVERKMGKWIKVGDNAYRCSVCDEVSCCMGSYCPDCGADMRGEEDGDQ